MKTNEATKMTDDRVICTKRWHNNPHLEADFPSPYRGDAYSLIETGEPAPPKDWKPACFDGIDKCRGDKYMVMEGEEMNKNCLKCPFLLQGGK